MNAQTRQTVSLVSLAAARDDLLDDIDQVADLGWLTAVVNLMSLGGHFYVTDDVLRHVDLLRTFASASMLDRSDLESSKLEKELERSVGVLRAKAFSANGARSESAAPRMNGDRFSEQVSIEVYDGLIEYVRTGERGGLMPYISGLVSFADACLSVMASLERIHARA